MNQLFVGIDVGSRGNTAYLMRPDGEKHSNFTVQNTQGGAKILIDKIVSALTTMGLEQVVIGTPPRPPPAAPGGDRGGRTTANSQ